MTTGVVALMLEANKNLSWRDVKYILAKTARTPSLNDKSTNSAGYSFHPNYGFGVIDAEKAVKMAEDYNINLSVMHHIRNPVPDIRNPVPVCGDSAKNDDDTGDCNNDSSEEKDGFEENDFYGTDNNYINFFKSKKVLLPYQVDMVKSPDNKIFIESLILEVRKSKKIGANLSFEPSTNIITSFGNVATGFVNVTTDAISSVFSGNTSIVQDLTEEEIVPYALDYLSKYELKEENGFIFVLISPEGTRSISVISESSLKQTNRRIQLLQNAYFGERAKGDWKLHIIRGKNINDDDLPALDWSLSIYGTKTDISKNPTPDQN